MDKETLDVLKSLHTSEIDARNGYEEALVDAEGKGLSPLFLDMVALHDVNAGEIDQVLIRLGEPSDTERSFMSVVNHAITNVRALFDGLGEGLLPGLIDGEERNLAKYDEALETATLPEHVVDLLSTQRGKIAAKISIMQMHRAA